MDRNEDDVPSPTMKRRPLLGMMGLLPEGRTAKMKMPVILIALLLVGIAFLGFRYWNMHQVNDLYQRRISFLEGKIYKSSRDGDVADARERDFQLELKKQKDKLVQMKAMMNTEVAKLSRKFELERESLMEKLDSKISINKQNGEVYSRLKKDYIELQQQLGTFQANQTELLEKFTTQSLKVEMLLKLKDQCYAQMRSIGRPVSAPASPGKEVAAQASPGEAAPAKDRPEAGTPARASSQDEMPARESAKAEVPARESAKAEVPARESAKAEVPARESPEEGVPARESSRTPSKAENEEAGEKNQKAAPAPALEPEGARAPAQPPQLGKEAKDTPPRPAENKEANEKEAKAAPAPALEPSGARAPAQPPQLGKEAEDTPPRPAGQSSVNEKAIEKEAVAAPAPALMPSNSRVPVNQPPGGKEHQDKPPGTEKNDTETKKQEKAASDASALKDNKDNRLPLQKGDEIPAEEAVNAPNSKNLPDTQPKTKENNVGKEEEEDEALD